jgi:hypothetical protein
MADRRAAFSASVAHLAPPASDVEVFTTTANGAEPLPAAPDGTAYDGVPVRYFPLTWPKR